MQGEYLDGLVSVVIPVYNGERFISQTIVSALSQTYNKVEVIVVDDNSTDKTSEIVDSLSKTARRIVYYRQNANFGAGVCRNKGLELARGRYVAFLDSDDVWNSDKLEKQLALMEEKQTPFSYTALEVIDKDGKTKKKKRKISKSCDYKRLLKNTTIPTSSVVIDRWHYGDFQMSARRGGQDYATWLKLLREGVTAYGINQPLVKYRVGKKTLSSNKFESIKQVWQIQTQEEKLCKFKVFFNVIAFVINATLKRVF